MRARIMGQAAARNARQTRQRGDERVPLRNAISVVKLLK
jgi:hypothetical protein